MDPERALAPRIEIAGLRKAFQRRSGERVAAVDGVSLSIAPGEFLVLLGPSGCGKTTLLRCLAGLEQPDDGEITVNGKCVFSTARRYAVPPERRGISMMFQSYALWPHMTCRENVAYPLASRGLSKTAIAERVDGVLTMVRCSEVAAQYPGDISGGQQQRVALARALVAGDSVLLFDEPLSNVDAKVREGLRVELIELQRQLGFSAVYVTHDQAEALALADRIAVLKGGRVAQLGPPAEIYRRPTSRYVASFVGTVNELPGALGEAPGGGVLIGTSIGAVACAGRAGAVQALEGEAVAVWRPESCRLEAGERPPGVNVWQGTVQTALFLGSHIDYVVDVAGTGLRARLPAGTPLATGTAVWVVVEPGDVIVLAP